jgi:lipid-A-disaccharide synthase
VPVPTVAEPRRGAREDAWALIGSGEVSSDVAGARVAAELRRRAPGLELRGVGGHRMAAAGVELLAPTNHLGVVGVSEVGRFLPELWRLYRALLAEVDRRPPLAALLLGNDLFHVALGRALRRRRVPVISYFPPQVWLWRSLLRAFVPSFDRVLTSFPEEDAAYRAAGASAEFVGHYLTDVLRTATPREVAAARRQLGLGDGPLVALFPGSRRQETAGLAPIVLDAAALLAAEDSRLRFVLALAEPDLRAPLARALEQRGLFERTVLCTDAHDALRAADLAVQVSGTASLEAALIGTPCVVVYRVSSFTRAVVRLACWTRLMDGETIALPNLVAGQPAVPELRQSRARPELVADAARPLLADPSRRAAMRGAFAEVRRRLERGRTVDRVAAEVLAAAGIHDVLASAAS